MSSSSPPSPSPSSDYNERVSAVNEVKIEHTDKDNNNEDDTTKVPSVELPGVGFTAKAMAARRAWETTRVIEEGVDPPRLFEDPFAEALAGEKYMEDMREMLKFGPQLYQFYLFFAIRTRFHDDAITENLDHIRQVVNLGSGMDTRAYRLHGLSPAVTIWEIDSAEVHEYKNQKLLQQAKDIAPNCRLITIATDLHKSEWVDKLLETSFDKSQPTIWILEGLIYYLTPESAEELLLQISSLSAAKSVFAADFINHATIMDPRATWNYMWKFGCEDPAAFLEKHGWSNVQVKTGYEIATQRYPGYDKEGIIVDGRAHKQQVWLVQATL